MISKLGKRKASSVWSLKQFNFLVVPVMIAALRRLLRPLRVLVVPPLPLLNLSKVMARPKATMFRFDFKPLIFNFSYGKN